jgi:hypothetical protein
MLTQFKKNGNHYCFIIGFAVLVQINCSQKDEPMPVTEPEYRIAFWSGEDDGCGYTTVYVDGVKKGEIKYWQFYGPTNCAESLISLSIPITKGKHKFLFKNGCLARSNEVDYEVTQECTLYKVVIKK